MKLVTAPAPTYTRPATVIRCARVHALRLGGTACGADPQRGGGASAHVADVTCRRCLARVALELRLELREVDERIAAVA